MARVRVLAAGLVVAGCFSDNGPSPQGGSSGGTSNVAVTTTMAEMSTSTSTGSVAQTSGGIGESGEASSGGADATTTQPGTSDPTSPETTGDPLPAGCPTDDTELRACYRFESVSEVTPDESAYAHAAKVDLAKQTTGRLGMGLDVTSASQVQAADADHLTLGESMTLSLWFNPRTLPGMNGYRMVLLDKNSEYGVIVWPAGISCSLNSSGMSDVYMPVVVNKWTHVGCVRTPDGIGSLYLDGVLQGMEMVGPIEMVELNGPLAIGNDSPLSKPTDGFDGVIDEVKIWGRALTAEEIQAQANP